MAEPGGHIKDQGMESCAIQNKGQRLYSIICKKKKRSGEENDFPGPLFAITGKPVSRDGKVRLLLYIAKRVTGRSEQQLRIL